MSHAAAKSPLVRSLAAQAGSPHWKWAELALPTCKRNEHLSSARVLSVFLSLLRQARAWRKLDSSAKSVVRKVVACGSAPPNPPDAINGAFPASATACSARQLGDFGRGGDDSGPRRLGWAPLDQRAQRRQVCAARASWQAMASTSSASAASTTTGPPLCGKRRRQGGQPVSVNVQHSTAPPNPP